ncbi:Uma2 family endonuclease [Rippkaea orientalis]|nr:Uma2 family endonuclease [Rippkaea orientalis]
MELTLEQMVVSPGQQLLIKDLSWSQFETILNELGESRAARLSYSNGLLEIMVPLPEHERNKEIIGDIVKILLEALNIDFEPLGSTTFKNPQMNQAVEPDTCFYITNQKAIIGKNRLDLTIDPPPDLAIEIDLTSRTQFDNYQLLGIPEVWRYSNGTLSIYLLENGNYIQSSSSPNFSGIAIIELINQTLQQSQIVGTSQAIKGFKRWVKENIH